MKKNEALYRAIGGISEEKAADAYLYTSEKQKNYRLRAVFSGVGIAAIVCSFFVLSFVLLKVSGPKTGPAATGAEESSVETMLEADTEAITTENAGTETITEDTAMDMTLEELFKTKSYKYFMPTEVPDDFIDFYSSIQASGERLLNLSEYKTKLVNNSIQLTNKVALNNYDYVQLMIIVAKYNFVATEKLSASDVEVGVYHESFNGEPIKPGINYSLQWVTKEGFCVSYHFKVYPFSGNPIKAKDLFDLAITAPFFKDHPIAAGEVNEPNKVSLTGDYEGVVLTVEFGSDRYCFTSLVDVAATLKNNTDHDITIVVPVTSTDKASHQEIQVSVFKKDNEDIRLKDLDTYGVPFDTGESYLTLKPGEEYVQKMRMTGDSDHYEETNQKSQSVFGVYTCRATFRLLNGETNTLEFEVPFEG